MLLKEIGVAELRQNWESCLTYAEVNRFRVRGGDREEMSMAEIPVEERDARHAAQA